MIKKKIITLLFPGLIGLSLLGHTHLAIAQDPAVILQIRIQTLIDEFTANRTMLERNKLALFEMVDQIASPVFDSFYISKLVMGKNWKKASNAQKIDFSREFKRLMLVTYATALLKFTGNEKLGFVQSTIKERKGVKFAEVVSHVTITEGNPIPVVYAMVKRNEASWKIYNLTIGDLNMVLNYRNVIQAMIHDKGIDGAIIDIKENNDRHYQ